MHIDQETRVFGLIGYPLGHSLSPLMHNLAFETMGVNAVYLPFAVAPNQISTVAQAAKTLHIEGFNVTIPFKETIIPYLDQVSPEARLCGSVNTVLIRKGLAVGYNTDGAGFMDALEQEGVEPPGLAVIIGAGGAARAIGYHLAARGSATVFLNRTPERALNLARDIAGVTGQECWGMAWDDARSIDFLQRSDLLVNTTPLGMYPTIEEMPPIDLGILNVEAVVSDIIYNPITTRFLQEARELGFKTVSGLGMFVHQGVRSWELFTGQKAPLQVMEDRLRSCLEKE